MASDTERAARSFTDDPLAHNETGEIRRDAFISRVVALIDEVGSQPNSTVLAIVGSWGLGKTTILESVTAQLRTLQSEQPWIVSEFNPWYFQDLPSLQAGFFRQLASIIPDGWTVRKARHLVADLALSVAPFIGVADITGIGSEAVTRVAQLTRGGVSVEDSKAAVARALEKVGRPVLIVVDDVDRLDPDELVFLFKLIRLVGRLPHVHYLLAYDEDTLLGALSQTGLVGKDSARRAIDYMEKIVQIRLDVPPIRPNELAAWVDSEIQSLSDRFNWALDAETRQRFATMYQGHIRSRLLTPRALRRFIAQAEAFAAAISSEVDFPDFLALSWLRAAEPLVYRAIHDNRAKLLPESATLTDHLIGSKRDPDAERKFWEGVLTRARVDDVDRDGIAMLLSELFPRFRGAWSKAQPSTHPVAPGRVANPQYFDRFFAFAIPEGDISDALSAAAASQIIQGIEGSERRKFERLWDVDPGLILAKLEGLWKLVPTGGVEALRWLAARSPSLPDQSFASLSTMSMWLGQSIFAQLRGDEPTRAVVAMSEVDTSLSYASDVIRMTIQSDAPPETKDAAFIAARDEFARLARQRFVEQGDVNPLRLPNDVWATFWVWLVVDEQGVRDWVDDHLARESWPLLDFLAHMVSRLVPSNSPEGPYLVGELRLADVERAVGVDRARRELADEIAAYEGTVPPRAEGTDDNRRALVLQTLRPVDRTDA